MNTPAAQLHIVEYGKPCQTPSGPIIRHADYGALHWTTGCPNDIIRLCEPNRLGPTLPHDKELPEDINTSFLLRPLNIQINGNRQWWVIAGRLETRPEGGESTRRYRIARYAALHLNTSVYVAPSAMYSALFNRPLVGITPDDQERPMDPLMVQSGRSQVKAASLAFAQDALPYIMSGVALGFVRRPKLEEFSDWMATLWWLIPPRLRMFFSLGWGVGASYSGHLAATFATAASASCALYDPEEGRWTHPRVKANGKPFEDRRLRAGQAYLFNEFGGELAAALDVQGRLPLPSNQTNNDVQLQDADPQPVFSSPAIVRMFRRPGLLAFDRVRLKSLEEWLTVDGIEEQKPNPPLTPRTVAFSETRQRVLRLLKSALAHEPERRKAERILIKDSEDPKLGFALLKELMAMEGEGIERARLVAYLASPDEAPPIQRNVFQFVTSAVDKGHMHQPLPEHLNQRFHSRMRSCLAKDSETIIELARRLVLHPQPGPVVRTWLQQDGHLLLICFLPRNEMSDAVDALPQTDSLNQWNTLTSRILEAAEPLSEDQALIHADPIAARLLQRHLLPVLWANPQCKETAVDWLRLTGDIRTWPPVMRAAESHEQFDDKEVVAVCSELLHAPRSLHFKLSKWLLRHWDIASTRFKPESFEEFLQHWNRFLADALFRTTGFETGDSRPIGDLEEEDIPALPPNYINQLIEDAIPDESLFDTNSAAFWRLSRRSRSSPRPRYVESIRYVDQGTSFNGKPTTQVLRNVVRMARLRRHYLEDNGEIFDFEWINHQKPWQKFLILACRPSLDFSLSAETMAGILMDFEREDIKAALDARRKKGQPSHSGLLLLAGDVFGSKFTPARWQDKFRQNGLWALFGDCPQDRHGSLLDAAKIFAKDDRQKLQLGEKYISKFAITPTSYELQTKVLAEIVIPIFDKTDRLTDDAWTAIYEDVVDGKSTKLRVYRDVYSTAGDFVVDISRHTVSVDYDLMSRIWGGIAHKCRVQDDFRRAAKAALRLYRNSQTGTKA